MTHHLKILQDMEDALDDAYASGVRNAKKEWVWLTPEEITALKHNGKRYISSQDFARAVEALSKEKNT